MTARMLYLHALSPIHSGTGQSTDVIDLPVARERVTGWPYLPGSSLKGVLRDACADADQALIRAAFGPETEHAADHAGALTFTDAHLLCLPVRSLRGTFAWLSCPLALRRWQRDHVAAGVAPGPALGDLDPVADAILVGADAGAVLGADDKVYLDDLDLHVTPSPAAAAIGGAIGAAVFGDDAAWRGIFADRFGIVADDVFTCLATTATEVVARIKMNDGAKTVAQGGLWYEEAVPAETIFACPVLAPAATPARNGDRPTPAFADVDLLGLLTARQDGLLQIGGGASVGRGLARIRLGEGVRP